MQPYPRAPFHARPGRLHCTGCLSARAMDIGFPTVAWHVSLGWAFALTPPILAGACGAYVWVPVFAFTLPFLADVCGMCARFGVLLSPRQILAGVLWCVCLCACSACTRPFLAGNCRAFVLVPFLDSPP